MGPNEYMRRAMAKEADQEEIRQWVYLKGKHATRLQNAVIGLMDECGELASASKKWLEYQGDLDSLNLLEECGDVLWRVCQVLKVAGFTLEAAMEANLNKLEKVRYNGTKCNPTEAAEHNRDREAECKAMDDGVNYEREIRNNELWS